MKFFRSTAFDLVRALSVFNLVFMHTGVFDWVKVSNTRAALPETFPPTIFQQVMFYCLTQGGMFHVISSGLFTFSSVIRLKRKENSLFALLIAGFISGAYLFFMHFFVEALVSQRSGLLYLWLYPTKTPIWDWEHFKPHILHNGTAAAIAINYFLVTIVVIFLFRNGGWEKKNAEKKAWTLIGLFVIVMLLTPFVRICLFAKPLEMVKDGNLLYGVLIALVCGNYFPMFPYLGYGFLGAGFGIFMVHRIPIKKYFKSFIVVCACFAVVGYSVLYFKFGQLYIGLFEEKSVRGMVFRCAMQYSQVVFFLTPFVGFLAWFDYRKKKVREWYKWLFSGLFRVQKLSLTIYAWEGVLKAATHYLWDFVYPEWNVSLGTVMLFGIFNFSLWYIIAMFWEKINYVGSHEWFFMKVIEILTGKKTRRFETLLPKKEEKVE